MKTHLVLCTLFVFILAIDLGASPAFTDTIQIHFSGLNVSYDGSDIFDSADKNGGNYNTAEADPLATIDFFKNDVQVGRLTADDNIYADLLVDAVHNIPVGGGLITTGDGSAGFGLDLLENTGAQTIPLLSLNIDQLTLSYSGLGIYMAVGGMADSLVAQNLPFGLTISANDQISLVFSSANLSGMTNNGNYLTHFEAFGTGDINATQYTTPFPEPATVTALLSLAATCLLTYFVRRRK